MISALFRLALITSTSMMGLDAFAKSIESRWNDLNASWLKAEMRLDCAGHKYKILKGITGEISIYDLNDRGNWEKLEIKEKSDTTITVIQTISNQYASQQISSDAAGLSSIIKTEEEKKEYTNQWTFVKAEIQTENKSTKIESKIDFLQAWIYAYSTKEIHATVTMKKAYKRESEDGQKTEKYNLPSEFYLYSLPCEAKD